MFMFSFYLSGMTALYEYKKVMSIRFYHYNIKLSYMFIGISEKNRPYIHDKMNYRKIIKNVIK